MPDTIIANNNCSCVDDEFIKFSEKPKVLSCCNNNISVAVMGTPNNNRGNQLNIMALLFVVSLAVILENESLSLNFSQA
jgi:hypothetical protein